MKTELETYLEFIEKIDEFNKNDTFLLKIKPKNDIEKTVAFYTVIYPDREFVDYLCHFRFVSKKIDNNALKDFERGLVNLTAEGYKINYYNASKDGQV